jgi:hypothetical protein
MPDLSKRYPALGELAFGHSTQAMAIRLALGRRGLSGLGF